MIVGKEFHDYWRTKKKTDKQTNNNAFHRNITKKPERLFHDSKIILNDIL